MRQPQTVERTDSSLVRRSPRPELGVLAALTLAVLVVAGLVAPTSAEARSGFLPAPHDHIQLTVSCSSERGLTINFASNDSEVTNDLAAGVTGAREESHARDGIRNAMLWTFGFGTFEWWAEVDGVVHPGASGSKTCNDPDAAPEVVVFSATVTHCQDDRARIWVSDSHPAEWVFRAATPRGPWEHELSRSTSTEMEIGLPTGATSVQVTRDGRAVALRGPDPAGCLPEPEPAPTPEPEPAPEPTPQPAPEPEPEPAPEPAPAQEPSTLDEATQEAGSSSSVADDPRPSAGGGETSAGAGATSTGAGSTSAGGGDTSASTGDTSAGTAGTSGRDIADDDAPAGPDDEVSAEQALDAAPDEGSAEGDELDASAGVDPEGGVSDPASGAAADGGALRELDERLQLVAAPGATGDGASPGGVVWGVRLLLVAAAVGGLALVVVGVASLPTVRRLRAQR